MHTASYMHTARCTPLVRGATLDAQTARCTPLHLGLGLRGLQLRPRVWVWAWVWGWAWAWGWGWGWGWSWACVGLVCKLGLVLGLGLGLGLCACLWVASTHGLLVVCTSSSVVARFDARMNLINARYVGIYFGRVCSHVRRGAHPPGVAKRRRCPARGVRFYAPCWHPVITGTSGENPCPRRLAPSPLSQLP